MRSKLFAFPRFIRRSIRAAIKPDIFCCMTDALSVWSQKKNRSATLIGSFGAGDEARTRYLHLGKVALYRMSYTRIRQMQI